jgi:hypothetical protein
MAVSVAVKRTNEKSSAVGTALFWLQIFYNKPFKV